MKNESFDLYHSTFSRLSNQSFLFPLGITKVPAFGDPDVELADDNPAFNLAAATTVQVPRSWSGEPELWFLQVENQFAIHRITSQNHQIELFSQPLPSSAISEVRDDLLAPLGDNHYEVLRQALTTLLVAHKQRRLQQLLNAEEMGDRKPPQFLCHQQHLLGNQASTLNTTLLRALFLQRIPPSVHVALVSAPDLP